MIKDPHETRDRETEKYWERGDRGNQNNMGGIKNNWRSYLQVVER